MKIWEKLGDFEVRLEWAAVDTRTNLFIEYAVFSVVEPTHTVTSKKQETL